MAFTRWLFRIHSNLTPPRSQFFNIVIIVVVIKYCYADVEGIANPALTGPGPCTEYCLNANLTNELRKKCPAIQDSILRGPPLRLDEKAGVLRKIGQVPKIEDCAVQCCSTDGCNIAIVVDLTCHLLFCNKGVEACVSENILETPSDGQKGNASMVLVQSPQSMIRKDSVCEEGLDQCSANEVCFTKSNRSRNGHCQCNAESTKNSIGKCILIPELPVEDGTTQSIRSSDSETPQTIEVTVFSKNITLPINEAYLSAEVTPKEGEGDPYTFEWLLISHPTDDSAALEGQTSFVLHLTGLKQGSYVFQIHVKGHGTIGSATATINVLPEKRINQAPVAIISPSHQEVQLPASSAVLDGSSSTDDDKIIAYTWELQKEPIQYVFNSKQNTNSSTLQVTDLIPGNYTFKLTVEDTDHATNSTIASIMVLKEIDYPPTANAGEDVIIYLPQSEVTLNGNASSDDKKIDQWEWKAVSDTNRAIDIQDTNTPYLKLSHLQEGMYQFELTVTDSAGQQSNPSTVHLFVKPPSGKPPTANAGSDVVLALPMNWVVLDSSESKSDTKILKWQWTQISGPNNGTIEKPTEIKTNVSGLTKGDYEFQVEVEDDAKLTAKDTVKITVAQQVNKPPKAEAGENVTYTLPVTVAVLNGTGSSDDVKVTEWKWEREPESIAAGVILGNSDTSSILRLTDLVSGKYIFKLTVKDEQGLSDSDIVELTVLDDIRKRSLVEIVVEIPLSNWTKESQDKLLQQFSLLTHDNLSLHHVSLQPHTEFTSLILYGLTDEGETILGLQLAADLRQRLKQDPGLLSFPVAMIDTVLCLDPCSGHGVCHDSSTRRECVCDTFWMQNFFKKEFGGAARNCDWSKIYVAVVCTLLAIMLCGLFWSLLFIFRRNLRTLKNYKGSIIGKVGNGTSNGLIRHGPHHKRHHSNKKQYTLLDDDEVELEIKADEADSDTSDSEVSLVEVKRIPKSNSITTSTSALLTTSLSNGTNRSNGILKHGRGVKA